MCMIVFSVVCHICIYASYDCLFYLYHLYFYLGKFTMSTPADDSVARFICLATFVEHN